MLQFLQDQGVATMRTAILTGIVSVFLAFPPAAASAFELFPFPTCDSGSVVTMVRNRFNQSERYGLEAQISSIDRMTETDVVYLGPTPIARRYCQGNAYLADGKKSTIYYLVESMMGLAGTGYNVEFCLAGHDPWRVYDGNCRVLKRWYTRTH
jgi:hypothetical protein